MKKSERAHWLMLAQIKAEHYGGTCLCVFCRYVEWDGFSCCESYPTCTNRLVYDYERVDCGDVSEGSDCWVFTPEPGLAFPDAVDRVGLLIRQSLQIAIWERIGGIGDLQWEIDSLLSKMRVKGLSRQQAHDNDPGAGRYLDKLEVSVGRYRRELAAMTSGMSGTSRL